MNESNPADRGEAPSWSREEVAGMSAMALFFSHLLLHRCDTTWLAQLEAEGVVDGLRELGLDLPTSTDEVRLEGLAVEYGESIANHAEGTPLVQSSLEGEDALQKMREVAATAGVRFDPRSASGAPVDHLGTQLELWSKLVRRDQKAAKKFAKQHLQWACPPLEERGSEGFYGQVSSKLVEFLRALPS